MSESIYKDISERTGGNIYIGVVGPVRSGKSTFITKLMNELVIPSISDENIKERATDELPQSAAGKTIMTTEPKFVPENAVNIVFQDNVSMNVRLIDCVGYIVPSAKGYIENEAPRMVQTPWFDEEVPFNMAAEVGTHKVITEHSTIGIVVTTDGSITDIPREEYEAAEERVIEELSGINKPFAVVLNCKDPESDDAMTMAQRLSDKYGRKVIPVNCLDITEADIAEILRSVLVQFPVREINIRIPKWVSVLGKEHWLKKEIFDRIRAASQNIKSMDDIGNFAVCMGECDNISGCVTDKVELGTGAGYVTVNLAGNLFYQILGETTGIQLRDEGDLMPCMIELAAIKKKYEKVKAALDEVQATGYGIVMPGLEELTHEEPEIVKQGGKYGIRLKASAPSVHMMLANINTEVSPIVGSEKQSEEL
ncbi:MAG: stage IV sporulation protein A, partial [Ruminiclostridium sp.]|nr:stage IV sporulation protein A [Ruminiclostridium sp.]